MSGLIPLTDEYPRRVEQARALMKEQGLDALLLFTGPNLVYFSGASGMMPGSRSGSRPFILLLPRRGEAVLIVADGRKYEAHASASVSDIRTYKQLSRLPLETLLEAINDRDLRQARIGAELGNEMVLDLPFGEFMKLQDALPKAHFVDASPLLWQLRMIKSEGEIARVARACEITAEAYARTFASIKPGMVEEEIECMMFTNMLALGGRSPFVCIVSGKDNYDQVSSGGDKHVVEPGDMVWMDCGCSVEGYWSDFTRGGVLGGPSPAQVEGHRKMYEITSMGVDMVRPGVPVADIGARANEALDRLGLPITSSVTELAGRIGHGLGMVITELPSVNEVDGTVLAPGMIVTIEPGVVTEYGVFMIEENVLVTEEGSRVLTSSAPWQLTTI